MLTSRVGREPLCSCSRRASTSLCQASSSSPMRKWLPPRMLVLRLRKRRSLAGNRAKACWLARSASRSSIQSKAASARNTSTMPIPIRLSAPRVQRHEEEVRLLKEGKPRAALLEASPAHDGTQRSREARQDAGVQQKGLHRLRLVGEDLLAQILDEIAVRAQGLAEKLTHLSLRALPLQQQRGQLQAGDPALGATEDRGERGGLQVPLQRQVQKGAGLGEIELQVSGAQLAQLAARSQPRKGQAWIGAARDEQVQVGWAVLHKLGDGVLERLKRDGVVVVQHQEELATGAAGQVVNQQGEDGREGEALHTVWRGEVCLDTGPKRGITGLEGGQQGGE